MKLANESNSRTINRAMNNTAQKCSEKTKCDI
jgi:hypothetical protein